MLDKIIGTILKLLQTVIKDVPNVLAQYVIWL